MAQTPELQAEVKDAIESLEGFLESLSAEVNKPNPKLSKIRFYARAVKEYAGETFTSATEFATNERGPRESKDSDSK